MKNIAHMLDVVDKVRDHMALGLMSDPGLSKTAQVKQWAAEHDRTYCELIISQRMPSEISGMPMPVQKTGKMEIFDFNTLLNLKDGDVLAFDEFTNGNIQTLNASLTLIQERTMLSGRPLPSLIIVAMGNPQGKCELLPQTKQRFWWVHVAWDEATWKAYMQRTWGITPNAAILSGITRQYTDGFNGAGKYNYLTPRTIENLFRVAMTVPKHDPFWEVSDVDKYLISALYDSLAGKEEFDNLVGSLTEWVRDHPDAGEEDLNLSLLLELSAAKSVEDLEHLVTQFEESGAHPAFLEFLKSSDEPALARVETIEEDPIF